MPISHTEGVLSSQADYTVVAIPPYSDSGKPLLMLGYGLRIALYRKARKWSQATLAEKLGVEQPTVQRWESETREPSLAKLTEMSSLFGIGLGELLGDGNYLPSGPRLFVKGAVAAGAWREVAEWAPDEWQTFTGRADVNADPQHRFGLLVEGDSMDVLYPPGTILECVSLFGHAEASPGKRVIVARRCANGLYETTCKELVEQDGEMWLVPRSHNPIHAPIKLTMDPLAIESPRIIAVVVSSVRPE